MEKVKSSVVNREVVRHADATVKKIVKVGGRIAGVVRRSCLLHQAVDAIAGEIEKNPRAFARYIVSRMAWDMLADKAECEAWVA